MNVLNAPVQCFWNRYDDGTLYSIQIVNEELNVDGNVALLDQIPDATYGISIQQYTDGAWVDMKELKTNVRSIGDNEYKVDWSSGWLWFNGSKASKRIRATYYGRGFWLISDKRLFTALKKNPDGTYDWQTLHDTVKSLQGYLYIGDWDAQQAYTEGNQVCFHGSTYMAVGVPLILTQICACSLRIGMTQEKITRRKNTTIAYYSRLPVSTKPQTEDNTIALKAPDVKF